MAGDPVRAGVNAVMGAAAGATYGFIAFARKREDATRETERWDVRKAIPTVLVAAAIGAVDGYVAGPEAVTPEAIATRLAMYGGVIFAVEQVLKTLRDRRENQRDAKIRGILADWEFPAAGNRNEAQAERDTPVDGDANPSDGPNRSENDTNNDTENGPRNVD